MKSLKLAILAFVSFLLLGNTIRTEETRRIMRSVFASLDVVLPLSLRLEEFGDKANNKKISNELTNLKINAYLLGKHVSTSTVNNKLAAENLIADIYMLDELYEDQNYEQARFVLHSLTENCTNCHTRMQPNNKLAPGFWVHFSKENQKGLDGLDLAHFHVVGRQFDEALAIYETSFRKEPGLIDSQAFYDYLKVAIRVKKDTLRVGRLLDEIIPKISPTLDIAKTARAWKKSIVDINASGNVNDLTITRAEALLGKAGALKTFPKDESGMIYLISASQILHTLLDSKKFTNDELSETYFLLGQTEGFISISCWLREYDQYYEYSIRAAPHSKWAERSMDSLKAEIAADFSGSSGTHIPSDTKEKLKELNNLITQSKKFKVGPRL